MVKALAQLMGWKQSPNFSSRGKYSIEAIIIHYDASINDNDGLFWLCNPMSKVSAHYWIARTGAIFQLVDDSMAAWHAGQSKFDNNYHVNQRTLGIELANVGPIWGSLEDGFWCEHGGEERRWRGLTPEFIKGGYWEKFPEAQLSALSLLLQDLEMKHGAAAKKLFGHNEVCIPFGRKIDPGPVFPWSSFRSVEDSYV